MWSEIKRAGVLALAMLLCSACMPRHDIPPGGSITGVGAADQRPCVANFSVEGGYWAGHTVKGFVEYPNTSKGETFAYLLSKISSVGYLIDSSDKETGTIRASYPLTFGKGETTFLNALVSRGQAGIRVDLAFMTGGMATFSIDEVQQEFCSILEGVPKNEAVKPVETPVREAPIVSEKPAVVEKPLIVENLGASAVQTTQPPSLQGLVVDKKANLRAKASTKSRIIGVLKAGEKLEVLGRSGDWFHVKSASGLTGWIFKTLVRTD
jgi:hypothetical protein